METIAEINEKLSKVKNKEDLNERMSFIVKLITSEEEYEGGDGCEFLPLHRLNSAAERNECEKAISKIIKTGQFTSGPFVPEVENLIKNMYCADACIATASGTDALKIALKASGIKPGDEVIIPLNSFAATENAVQAVGATPVFANVDHSYNMDSTEVSRLRTARTGAVLPVCLYGSERNLSAIFNEARKYDLPVIADAAQCYGMPSTLDHCDAACLSFNPFKNIGSFGKSGAILTRSASVALIARQYAYHGFYIDKKNIKAQDWSFNARMDNLQAATLKAKLNFFAANASKRCFLAHRYLLSMQQLTERVTLPVERIRNTWHLFPLQVETGQREALVKYANARGVELPTYYPRLSHQGTHPFARNYPHPQQFSRSERIQENLIHLPIHNHMSIKEQDNVIGVINDYFN